MQCSRLAAMPASSSLSSRVKEVGKAVHTPWRTFFAYSLASFLRYFMWTPPGCEVCAKHSKLRTAKPKREIPARRLRTVANQGIINLRHAVIIARAANGCCAIYLHMRAKFENCAARVLTPGAAAAVCRGIDSLEQLGSLREFTALFEPPHAASENRRLSVLESGVA